MYYISIHYIMFTFSKMVIKNRKVYSHIKTSEPQNYPEYLVSIKFSVVIVSDIFSEMSVTFHICYYITLWCRKVCFILSKVGESKVLKVNDYIICNFKSHSNVLRDVSVKVSKYDLFIRTQLLGIAIYFKIIISACLIIWDIQAMFKNIKKGNQCESLSRCSC